MMRAVFVIAMLAMVVVLLPVNAQAFILSTADPPPWLSTASGSRSGNGAAATITWSIVPDGTTTVRDDTTNATAPSNFISFMNSTFGGSAGQTDLTQQPWFHLLGDSFGRWSQLGGVNFVYEPHDDGVFHPSSNGALGVRGDIRIGGANVDGAGSILAFTYLPTGGSDMVVDTAEASYFGSNSDPNRLRLRNTMMHEIGHAFGLLHVDSSSSLLMEPVIDTSFDGPQLDEVRGVQFFFGDPNEKSNGGLGNGTVLRATSMGAIAPSSTVQVGVAANVATQAIGATATDFVSISNASDTDFYSFSVSSASLLSATLIPRGGVFTQGSADDNQTPTSFNANARNNLSLAIVAANGTTVLSLANSTAAGGSEAISNLLLPAGGTYFARITGSDDTIQLYQLSMSAAAILLGDYNKNGVVDAADYAVWRNSQGQTVTAGSGADGNFDGQITTADFNVWREHFGQTAGSGSASLAGSAAVPEPAAALLVGIAMLGFTACSYQRRRPLAREVCRA